jgi:hypothetical protein
MHILITNNKIAYVQLIDKVSLDFFQKRGVKLVKKKKS